MWTIMQFCPFNVVHSLLVSSRLVQNLILSRVSVHGVWRYGVSSHGHNNVFYRNKAEGMYYNLFLNNNQYLTKNDITGLERDTCIYYCIFITFISAFIINGQGWATLSFEVHGPIYSLQSKKIEPQSSELLKSDRLCVWLVFDIYSFPQSFGLQTDSVFVQQNILRCS